MGGGQSKEELLYQAVTSSNHQAVKTLRRDGASLEFVDKEGRTPLILACTRGDLYDMVITLLNEGAKLDAYRSGPHGGYPLHHSAKRGLDKTVLLLLSRGANPLAINDDSLTPLDMARNKSHVSVVRIIEDRICLFSGTVRELSGPGFLEVIVPKLVTNKVWVTVLPTESDPRKIPRNELVIYQNSRVAIPRTVISLAKAELEEPRFNHHDPTFVITAFDKAAKVRFKFMAENEGDKAQLEKFYKACARGIYQTESGPPIPLALSTTQVATQRPQARQLSAPNSPPNPASESKTRTPTSSASGTLTGHAKQSSQLPASERIPDEIALAWAIDASILSASQQNSASLLAQHTSSWDLNDRGASDGKKGERAEFGGWAEGHQGNYSGWGLGSTAGGGQSTLASSAADCPSTSGSRMAKPVPSLTSGPGSSLSQPLNVVAPSSTPPVPSAPPLPLDGPIQYPSVDSTPVHVNFASAEGAHEAPCAPTTKPKDEGKSGGHCVVCWDAPAEAICIPCGHLSGCMDCLTEIKSKDWGCPVCRASIQQVVKVYAV